MIKIFLSFGKNTQLTNPLNNLNPDKNFDEKKAKKEKN